MLAKEKYATNVPGKNKYIESRTEFLVNWEEQLKAVSGEITDELMHVLSSFIFEKYGNNIYIGIDNQDKNEISAYYIGGPDGAANNHAVSANEKTLEILQIWYPETNFDCFLDWDAADNHYRGGAEWVTDLSRKIPTCKWDGCEN